MPPTKAKTEEVVMNERPPSEGYEPSIADEFQQDPALEDQELPPVPSDDDLEGPEVDLDRLLEDPHYTCHGWSLNLKLAHSLSMSHFKVPELDMNGTKLRGCETC